MKQSIYSLAFFFIVFNLSCDHLADECSAGDPINIERTFFFKLTSNTSSFEKEGIVYDLSTASSVVFTGNVSKYYCDHKRGGSFNFSKSFYPSTDEPLILNLLKIAGPYNMKFDHSADYVEITFKIRATFDELTVFDTYDINVRKFPNEFNLDANNFEYYHTISYSQLTFFTRL